MGEELDEANLKTRDEVQETKIKKTQRRTRTKKTTGELEQRKREKNWMKQI